MPPIKLSRVMYVPETPQPPGKGPGKSGKLDVGDGQSVTLPNGSRHGDIDPVVLGEFLDAITKHGVTLDDALKAALAAYTKVLNP